MSTKVTPESLRTHAEWLDDRNVPVEIYKVRKAAAVEMHRAADCLEQERRPLPERPGWYELIVVERRCADNSIESHTGAFRDTSGYWHTQDFTVNGASPDVTIRWAAPIGTTPGQTLWEADPTHFAWSQAQSTVRDESEHMAAVVLATHGTPILTPVGEHPEPGARGLLPVVATHGGMWETPSGWVVEDRGNRQRRVLADPRPDGAHE